MNKFILLSLTSTVFSTLLVVLTFVVAILPPAWSFSTASHTQSVTRHPILGRVEIPKGPAPFFIMAENDEGEIINATPLLSSPPPASQVQVQVENSTKTTTSKTPPSSVPCPNCDLCDGTGRISGGIGAVLDWWPIKAYRPCPNFLKRGGKYSRAGQGLDEIAFGRDSKFQKE
jgi:hypothetical protein